MVFRIFGRVRSNFADDRGRQQASEPIFQGFGVIFVMNEALFLDAFQGAFLIHFDGDIERAFPLRPIDRQHPVAF